MSTRDRFEVAVRSQVNRYIRVPAWRRAAIEGLGVLPDDGSVPWREGIVAWLAGRDDPPLRKAREAIEAERAAMLRDETSIQAGRTGLMTIANACNKMSSPPQLGGLLYWLVRTSGAREVLELGTALGFSAAYMAAALPPSGTIVTVERRQKVAERAGALFAAAGLDGRIQQEVGDFFAVADVRLEGRTFDAMFKDGGHTRKATESFFDQWAPRCRSGAVVMFDDIDHARARRANAADGMDRAWETIVVSPRVRHAVALHRLGVVALA